jgi:uncharacterized iron-regulated membrane protein
MERPEKVWMRQLIFQVHLWLGAFVTAYVLLMSLSGSVIVFRNELSPIISIEWLVRLHRRPLPGYAGDIVNALGACSLLVLCFTGAVVWWPGRAYWRRSLTVEWRARGPRISWDAHSAFGFWFLIFVVLWGVSGLYLTQPRLFEGILSEQLLFVLAELHFGRFNRVTEVMWAASGLVPALLALTGLFIFCRRCLLRLPSNPKHVVLPR